MRISRKGQDDSGSKDLLIKVLVAIILVAVLLFIIIGFKNGAIANLITRIKNIFTF